MPKAPHHCVAFKKCKPIINDKNDVPYKQFHQSLEGWCEGILHPIPESYLIDLMWNTHRLEDLFNILGKSKYLNFLKLDGIFKACIIVFNPNGIRISKLDPFSSQYAIFSNEVTAEMLVNNCKEFCSGRISERPIDHFKNRFHKALDIKTENINSIHYLNPFAEILTNPTDEAFKRAYECRWLKSFEEAIKEASNNIGVDQITKNIQYMTKVEIDSKNTAMESSIVKKEKKPPKSRVKITNYSDISRIQIINDLQFTIYYGNSKFETILANGFPSCWDPRTKDKTTAYWGLIFKAFYKESLDKQERFKVNDAFRRFFDMDAQFVDSLGELACNVFLPQKRNSYRANEIIDNELKSRYDEEDDHGNYR